MPRAKRRLKSEKDWTTVRVWYSAKHKWHRTIHVAASGSDVGGGNLLVTRCGLRIYKNTKQFKLYEWNKSGSPVTPTCGQCLKLLKYDKGELDNPIYMHEYDKCDCGRNKMVENPTCYECTR